MADSLYNSQRSVPAGKMEQLAYTEKAKAKKTMDLQVIPDSIIADATAGALVGKGNLCRVKGTAGGFISFGTAASMTTPSALTTNTMETEAKYFLIVATDEFVKTSAAMRIEVIND